MLPSEAMQGFERILAVRNHRIADLTVPASVDLMLAFYDEVRVDGCDLTRDGDMLLYQWGTFDWGNGKQFQLDITRQFMFDACEDEDIWQLSLTFVYTASPTLDAVASGNRWCHSLEERGALRAFILASSAYAAASVTPALRIDLKYRCAG
jgi:hypothetical protein